MRSGLFVEIVAMAFGTLRTQKMRSALTVLGIAIGITSLVSMTSLIRGFTESLKDQIRQIGPETIMVAQFSGISMMQGADFMELLQRPTLTVDDAEAIERQASESIASVNIQLGGMPGPGAAPTRLHYQGERTKPIMIAGTTSNFPDVYHIDLEQGRFFTDAEVSHRRRVVVLGYTTYEALFPNVDPIGKTVRVGTQPYTVVGVMAPRPVMGGMDAGQDDVAVIPHTAYQKQFGVRAFRSRRGQFSAIMIAAVPREGMPRDTAERDITEVMRIRHGLRLDEPNDFDLMTQDAALQMFDQITGAMYLALGGVSSIALLVGGIGVMAIMTISVKERTREIGTRKALGARRREILQQFLLEAVFLTAVGGVIGIILGSSLAVGIFYATGFPMSLPWWSFALGVGFSASVGIVFGMFPAVKASGLDPIEALRYE